MNEDKYKKEFARLRQRAVDAKNEARQYKQMYTDTNRKLMACQAVSGTASEYEILWKHALKSFQNAFVENEQLKRLYSEQQDTIAALSKELTKERKRVAYVLEG